MALYMIHIAVGLRFCTQGDIVMEVHLLVLYIQ